MRSTRILAVLGTALALSATGVSTASATGDRASGDHRPQVGSLSRTAWNNGHDTASVSGSYRCWAPDAGEITHLWVSVKQGGPDPTAEGSSATVDAWYDTNVSEDTDVRCDGRWHHRTVTLGRHDTDFTGRELDALENGRAWLQFCLVQGPADAAPDSTESVVASRSRWVDVRGFGHHGGHSGHSGH